MSDPLALGGQGGQSFLTRRLLARLRGQPDTAGGEGGRTTIDQREAVKLMLRHYEICVGLFHGFDWSAGTAGPLDEWLALLPAAQEHIPCTGERERPPRRRGQQPVAGLRPGGAA